jgi:hypothetical protein
MTLAEGLRFERRIFHGLFATNDQKEGAWHSTEIILSRVNKCLRRYGRFRGEEEGQFHSYINVPRKCVIELETSFFHLLLVGPIGLCRASRDYFIEDVFV